MSHVPGTSDHLSLPELAEVLPRCRPGDFAIDPAARPRVVMEVDDAHSADTFLDAVEAARSRS